MAFENLCMYCFEDNGGADVCPHCGRDARAAVPQIQLLPGTLVYNQRFLIGRALGQDASGIVYAALDTKRNVKIRIREYLPRDCARRLNSGEIVPEPGAEEQFEQGMAKLRASVEGVEDPAKRHFFFEENGTGYIAQRKASAASDMGGGDEPGERRGAKMAMVVAIAAILVLAVAIGVIALVSYFTSSTDKRTEAPMVTGADIWQAPSTPTPTPYAAATFGTLSEPTHSWMDFTNPDLSGNSSDFAKPTPAPTPQGGLNSSTINANSDPELITKLQTLLNNLGWLDKENINGKYDDATKQAVKDFQQYMNDTYALDPRLAVDGIAGKNTITWLLKTDIAMKPTPTPVPVTPSPTQAGQVVDENSAPESIKYVQSLLVKLGIMESSQVDGKYGTATRNAVKNFQMRVNDLLGYDALNEDGVCDDRTLAYLEYYVEWWENNKPTPAPTDAPTIAPTVPAPEMGGEVIDENSNKVSIQRVQEMLIALGYLDGKADGVYGKKTFDAVKAFQQDIHDKVDPKVQITGKVDILTREYLEYYSERANETATPAPKAPEISVSGHKAYENGVYVVGEGGAKIAWKAEGAQSYCVELINEDGRLVTKEDSTPYTSLSLSTSNLPGDGVYKFSVTVLDKDGKRGAAASVNVRAEKAEEVAPMIPVPTITVSGSLSYEGGVYRIGSSGATLSWIAQGAEEYSLYIYDGSGAEIYASEYTDMTAYQLEAASMTPGERYTFAVVAILADGTPGESASVNLMLEAIETPEPTPAPATDFEAPVITVNGALGELDGVYYVGEDKASICWTAEGSVRAYSVYLQNSIGDVLVTHTETDRTSMNVDPATMTQDEEYTVTVIAIPENGAESHGKSAQVRIALYNGQTPAPTEEPLAEIGQVTVTVSGHKAEDDGLFYAGDEDITVAWHAEGNVKGYDVIISDDAGNVLIDRELVSAKDVKISPKDLTEDVSYTVSVTAVPAGGTAEDGNSASVQLIRASIPALGDVMLTVSGYEAENDGTYYVGDAPVTIEWASEHAVEYSIYLSDADGKVLKKVENTAETRLSMGSDGMAEGEVYTLTVIAISPSGDTDDNKSAAVYLSRAEKPVELGDVSINVTGYADKHGDVYVLAEGGATVKWIAENAAAYDVVILEEAGEALKTYEAVTQTEMQVDASAMQQGIVYTLSITPIAENGDKGEAGSVMLAIAEPEPTSEPLPEIGSPVIYVTGHDGFENGVYLIGSSAVTVEWAAENAEVYNVYVYGEDGDEIISAENAEVLSMTVKPADMPKGETVTVAVSGAADGVEGETAYVKLMLVEAEPTPEPTAEPTPEPVELGKPQLSVEGYDEVVDGVYIVSESIKVNIYWSAENADVYDVAILDEDGDIIKAAEGTTQTAMAVDPATMADGAVYTVRVTPVAADGTAGEYGTVRIAKATIEPTPEPTPEPVEIGNASISVSGHIELSDNVYIVGEDDLHISWHAENAAKYDAVIYSGNGDVLTAAEGTTATEFTLKAKDVPEGDVLTLTVIGIGANGEYGVEASVLIAKGEDSKWPINADSKPEYIQELQVQLYTLGWILPDDKDFVEIGKLDAITVQAVYDFQSYIIEMELNPEMVLIDMMNPVIDEVTLTMLFDVQYPIYRPQ